MDIPNDDENNPNYDQNVSGSPDDRINKYDNFPADTKYTGKDIYIGLLDTGIFDADHSNFGGITAETIYDKYTGNDSSDSAHHPTWVASVLGGYYGYASKANIYYVDVNSETGYVGIERLITQGCHIINMSISSSSCDNNGEYNTGLEGYLDYIYTSSGIVMIASAGNSLNKEGTGGYVALPALLAVLSATANNSDVDTSTRQISMYEKDSSGSYILNGNTITCTNNLKSNGSRERTGAGLLDVKALLDYSPSLLTGLRTFSSTDPVELKSFYLKKWRNGSGDTGMGKDSN